MKFDTIERARRPFAGAARKAAELFGDERTLFVKGAKNGALLFVSSWGRGLFHWLLYLDTKAIVGEGASQWLNWLGDLCEVLPVLFGSVCTEEEWSAKHEVTDGPTGRTINEFYQYLPGVYWATVFGAAVVEGIGSAKFEGIAGTNLKRLKGKQLLLSLTEDIVPSSMEERLRVEQTIAGRLGTQYFFDRASPGAAKKPLRTLQKLIGDPG